jgi:hypothetical protein
MVSHEYLRKIEGRSGQVIFECTGSAEFLGILGSHTWVEKTWFVSISLSIDGIEGYVFMCKDSRFPTREFNQLLEAWSTEHPIAVDSEVMPYEEVGCWHPLFSARRDQVALFVAQALREADMRIAQNSEAPVLIVVRPGTAAGDGVSVVIRSLT